MTRRTVVPPALHTKASLHDLLARTLSPSMPFAARYIACLVAFAEAEAAESDTPPALYERCGQPVVGGWCLMPFRHDRGCCIALPRHYRPKDAP